MSINQKILVRASLLILFGFTISKVSASDTLSQALDKTAQTSTLRDKILAMDSLLFNKAFNDCHLDTWEKILA